MRELTPDELNDIKTTLEGSSGVYDHVVIESYGLQDHLELETIAEQCGVVRCTECGWWSDVDETNVIDDEIYCDECRPNEEE